MAADATLWRERLVRSSILAAVVLLAAGLAFWAGLLGSGQGSTVTIGGPFTLTTHAGDRLSDADLSGKPYTVFFGFTHCPEVCPTTLWEMSESLKALGPDADRLRVLFVTVDPERDTQGALARYMQSFDPRIVGLTGRAAEIEALGKAYRAYWRKVPTDDGDYTMDHTASVFLMDAAGHFAGTIDYAEQASVRLEKLRRLLARG